MEIHAPESPIHSAKDFLVHMGVITCGILIALGLEGIREVVHNHHLVRETRETIHVEMEENLDNSKDEFKRVSDYRKQIATLITDLPTLAHDHPEQINQRLSVIENPQYFFSATSWQTSLSTGALEHMSTDEVTAYAGAAEGIRIYTGLQQNVVTEEAATKAFFSAHPHPTPEQQEQGMEHLLLFFHAEQSLEWVGKEMKSGTERAYRASDRY